MRSTRAALGLISSLLIATTASFIGCGTEPEASPPNAADDGAPETTTVDAAPREAAADVIADTATPEPFFDCSQDAALEAPTHLRCAGLYDRWTTKTVKAGVREFKPAVTLWTDGAEKRRWVSLPAGAKIDTTDMDAWKFPVGTKFFKEFVLAGKRVETRMFWKISDAKWVKTTYQWSADELTATRLDTGYTQNDPSDPAASGYEIPSVAKCDQCHDGSEDKILGFEAVGLGAAGATGYTLAQLVTDGKLTANPAATTLTIPEDGFGSANALGWLHANCGTACHNRNPAASCNFKGMYLRLTYTALAPSVGTPTSVTSLDSFVTTYDIDATIPAGYKRFAPKNPENSAIHFLANQRDNTRPNGQMPPIDSHLVDPTGVGFLNTWITARP